MQQKPLINMTKTAIASFDVVEDCAEKKMEIIDGFRKFAKPKLEWFEFRSGQSVFIIIEVKNVHVVNTSVECTVSFDIDVKYLGEMQYVSRDLLAFLCIRLEKHEFTVKKGFQKGENKFTVKTVTLQYGDTL